MTTPLSQRFFKAIWYLLSPMRSRYLQHEGGLQIPPQERLGPADMMEVGHAGNISKNRCKGVRTALRHRHSPLAEGQGPEIPVDDAQQLLGPGQAQGHVATVKVLHVVAALQVLMHIALACTAAEAKLTRPASMKAAQTWTCLCTA